MKLQKQQQHSPDTEIIVEVKNCAKKQARHLGLIRVLERKIKLFKQNPKLPGLHVEKLEPRPLGHWSFRINIQYRARFIKESNNKIVIFRVEDYH